MYRRIADDERVRDKISVSRQRGIWMGGMPPLGYDVMERKLIANPTEAPLVAEMFSRFTSVAAIAQMGFNLVIPPGVIAVDYFAADHPTGLADQFQHTDCATDGRNSEHLAAVHSPSSLIVPTAVVPRELEFGFPRGFNSC
jgi:hypothetical protein